MSFLDKLLGRKENIHIDEIEISEEDLERGLQSFAEKEDVTVLPAMSTSEFLAFMDAMRKGEEL